jgi:hypothetical protein|tara:strand:- start:158 stop:760 length:603 start_codon:yes stop_codon:yes gene_type:complete
MLNLIFCLFISPSYGKEVWVRPYTRSDGTSVSGHYRTISGTTSTAGVIPYADLAPQQKSNKGNFSLDRGFTNGSPYVQLKWSSGYYRFRSTCTNEGEQHTVSYKQSDIHPWSDYYLLENKLWVDNDLKEKFSINAVQWWSTDGYKTQWGMKSFSTYIITERVNLKSGETEKWETTITSPQYRNNDLIGDYLSSCRTITEK